MITCTISGRKVSCSKKEIGIQKDNLVESIEFVFPEDISGSAFIKTENPLDKTPLTVADNKATWDVEEKSLVSKTLHCQLQVEDGESIWQSEVFYFIVKRTISADAMLEEDPTFYEYLRGQVDTAVTTANQALDTSNEVVAEEETRQTSEETRVSQESDRVTAETNRQSNEETRQTNETDRVAAEDERGISEVSRSEAEAWREHNETTRQSQEGTRQSNESSRTLAEASRGVEENDRQSQEVNRRNQETTRQSQENTRQTQESTRQSQESTRQSQESTRQQNETSRGNAETSRESAEDTRESQEDDRQANEGTRASAEESRIAAEVLRASSEATRQSQEVARQASITDIENRFTQLTVAEQQASEVVDARTSTELETTFSSLNARLEHTEQEVFRDDYASVTEASAIISVPANAKTGIVRPEFKALTLRNDIEGGLINFTSPYGTKEIVDNVLTYTVVTPNSSARIEYVPDNLIVGHKYFSLFKASPPIDTIGRMFIGGAFTTNINMTANQIAEIYGINTVTVNNEFGLYVTTSGMNIGDEIQYFGDIFRIDMTALGIEDWTEEQMLALIRSIGVWEGTINTPALEVRSVGKNLFDRSKGVYGQNKRIDETDGLPYVGSSNAGDSYSDYIKIKPYTSYKLSGQVLGLHTPYALYDASRNYVYGTSGKNFTVPDTKNAYFIRFSLFEKDNIQLERGDTATAYEPYTEDIITIPAVGNSLPNGVADRVFRDESGKWWHEQNVSDDGETALATPILTELTGQKDLTGFENGTHYITPITTPTTDEYGAAGIAVNEDVTEILVCRKYTDIGWVNIDIDDITLADGYMTITDATEGDQYWWYGKLNNASIPITTITAPVDIAGRTVQNSIGLQRTNNMAKNNETFLLAFISQQRAFNLLADARLTALEV